MDRSIFDPERYGRITCPFCNSHGFILDPKRRCCPKCGGFGTIIKGTGQDTNDSNYRTRLPFFEKGGI
jgi:hypothetical protein